LAEALFLVKNGVPFDIAFSLPHDERLAYIVVFGMLDGRRFDWDSLTWLPDPSRVP
jgi:hypothetical protein